jgi:hypothetical protein
MGFFQTIKQLFGGGGTAPAAKKRVYVVDGARILSERRGGRLTPRDQLHILKILDDAAKAEGFAIQTVLESERPLREVDDGGEFGSVRVYFAKTGAKVHEQMMELVRQAKSGVLVGSGTELEVEAAKSGLQVMNPATFRRAFCRDNRSQRAPRPFERPPAPAADSNGQGENGEGAPRRRRHRGGRHNRNGKNAPNGAPAAEDAASAEKPAEKPAAPFTGSVGPVDLPEKPAAEKPAPAPQPERKADPPPSQAVKNMIDLI